jgi:hypothetical protein
VQAASRRIGCCLFRAAWAYGVETTGPSVFSPCSRRAVALHRKPLRLRISLRIGYPRRPCSSSLHRSPVSGSRLSAACPGTWVRSTSALGPVGAPETPGIASGRPASPSCPRTACHLSTAAWRKAALHRRRFGECAGRWPASGWDPYRRCGVRRRSTDALSAVVFRDVYAPRRRSGGTASPRFDPPPWPFGRRPHRT